MGVLTPQKERVMATGTATGTATGPSYSKYTYYGINVYDTIVNAVVADFLLILRSKRMPTLETLLKHGGMTALINVAGSVLATFAPVANVNELAVAAAVLSGLTPGGSSPTYLAGEQMLISSLSHVITTKSGNYALGNSSFNTLLGNAAPVTLNPNASLNF